MGILFLKLDFINIYCILIILQNFPKSKSGKNTKYGPSKNTNRLYYAFIVLDCKKIKKYSIKYFYAELIQIYFFL